MANIIFKTLQRTPQLSRLASPSLCFSSYRHILTPSTTRFVRFNSTTRQTTGNNDSDKNQQKPQLSLRDIMPAASKVFLYAFLTYFVLHSVWWNLELENRTKQFNEELGAIETKIYKRVAEIESKQKAIESCKLETVTPETTESLEQDTKKQKKGWFSF